MFYFTKKPWILKQIYGDCLWEVKEEEKSIYLTFDDGPHAQDTPFILDELKKYDAKGTFFCLGRNVVAHPEIYTRIREEGHSIGNHTYDHYDGWRTNNDKYFEDITKAKEHITSTLFRPPFGHITRFEVRKLREQFGLKTIMWTIMAGDFDPKTTGEQCLNNVIGSATPGAIVVFHDNDSASRNMRYALPKAMEYFSENGYTFKSIR
jgi:peptidoglycan/xylan/chitin deacetylase (PgdA/CDA1 family)